MSALEANAVAITKQKEQKEEKENNHRAISMLRNVFAFGRHWGNKRTTAVAIYYTTFSKRMKKCYACSVFFWLHLVYPTLISIVTVDFKTIHFP